MNLWKWACKNSNATYVIMLILGIVLLGVWKIFNDFSLELTLKTFPVVASITAAYLWIRRDVWRDDKTIKALTNSNAAASEDLILRRSDSQMALILLVLVAIAQALLLEPKTIWNLPFLFGVLFTLVPLCNWIARWMGKRDLSKFNN